MANGILLCGSSTFKLIFQVTVFYMLIEAYASEVGIQASIARRQREQHEPLNFLLKSIPWVCSGSKDSPASLPVYETARNIDPVAVCLKVAVETFRIREKRQAKKLFFLNF